MPLPKPRRPKPGDLVVVYWVDTIEEEAGWHSQKELRLPPKRCQSVGWVHVYNADFITIYATHSEDDGVGRIETIPKAWQVRILHIEEPHELA